MKISLYSSKSIHLNLLQEKLKMEELQHYLDGAPEGDCKKHGEAVKLQQVSETYHY